MFPSYCTMEQNYLINLKEICKSIELLCSIVEKAFGPNGKLVFITTSTGEGKVSRCGEMILKYYYSSNPFCKLISNSVVTFKRKNGDGTKTCLLYLQGMISYLKNKEIKSQNDISSRNFSLKCLQNFSAHHIGFLIQDLENFVYEQNKLFFGESSDQFIFIAECIAKNIFTSLLNEHDAKYLSKIVIELLVNKSIICQSNAFNFLHWFEQSCHCLPGLGIESTKILNGIVLKNKYLHGNNEIDHKFACLKCTVDGSKSSIDEDNKESVSLTSENLQNVLKQRQKILHFVLKTLKTKGVSLVLTSEKTPDYVVKECRNMDVAVISCVDETELDLIAYSCGINCIHDIQEIHSVQCIGDVHTAIVNYGNSSFIQLLPNESEIFKPKTIFICAPTLTMCKDIKAKIASCLRLMTNFLNSPCVRNSNRHIVAGGGCFELLVIDFLKQKRDESKSEDITTACEIINAGQINFVQHLCQALSRIPQRNLFLDLLKESDITLKKQPTKTVGLNRNGSICDPREFNVLDFFDLKCSALCASLQLLIQLLKIDAVLPVCTNDSKD